MKVSVVNRNGEDTGRKVDLPKDVFGIEPNDHAIYLDVKQFLANQTTRYTQVERTCGNCWIYQERSRSKKEQVPLVRAASSHPSSEVAVVFLVPEPRDIYCSTSTRN